MANIKLNYKLSVYTKLGLQNDLVKEAPSDGVLYGRQNGEWVEIKNTSSNLPDLTDYVTKNELTTELSNYIDREYFTQQTNEFVTKNELNNYVTNEQLDEKGFVNSAEVESIIKEQKLDYGLIDKNTMVNDNGEVI